MFQSGSRRLMLLRRYLSYKKENSTLMKHYLYKVKSNIYKLESMNVIFSEELTVFLLLGSLSEEDQLSIKALFNKDSLLYFCKLLSKLLNDEL